MLERQVQDDLDLLERQVQDDLEICSNYETACSENNEDRFSCSLSIIELKCNSISIQVQSTFNAKSTCFYGR